MYIGNNYNKPMAQKTHVMQC